MKREQKIPGLGLTPSELARARAFRAKPYTGAPLTSGGENFEYEPPPSQPIIINVQINVNQTFNYYSDNRQVDNRQVTIDNRQVYVDNQQVKSKGRNSNETQNLLDL